MELENVSVQMSCMLLSVSADGAGECFSADVMYVAVCGS